MSDDGLKMINPYMISKNIYFRSPLEEDVDGRWYEWFSDEETTKMLDTRFWPNSKKEQLEFYNSLHNDKTKLVLSIVTKSDNQHMGVISLGNINWVHRYADIGIIIGEKEFNNGVYASEAYAMILSIAFLRLNLLNVRAAYCESNKSSSALLKMFKFKVAGVFKNLVTIDGKDDNMVFVYLDRQSWLKRNLQG